LGDLEKEEVKRTKNEANTADSTLYVKNLNFITTESDLSKFFNKSGTVRHVTIAKKKDMKNEGKLLSLGYGFVEFDSRDNALEAFKTLQGQQLHSHALVLKLSKSTGKLESTNRKATLRHQQSTKLLIRNVPFQAKKNEIRALFAAFGEVKAVRLPLKQGGKGHRGFAFVEFLTVEEAKNALNALANTHIYGKHLVIDYAKEGETIEELREKTKNLYEKTH